jgi:hypothetical protein
VSTPRESKQPEAGTVPRTLAFAGAVQADLATKTRAALNAAL